MADISSAQSRAIRKWSFLFDQAYRADASPFSGWVSSYDGQPIPLPEMEDWLDATIDRILGLRPTSILEIGCGTGLIARRVIPEVGRYAGVDISAAAIAQLEASIGPAANARFACAAAHEVAALFGETFDLVILNSVVQYFTDVDYLEAVLADAIALLRPDGALFLGDLRNADLAGAFAASVALRQASPDATPDELRARADTLSAQGELQLSPAYVRSLRRKFPRLSAVTMLLKPGQADNELTSFRYDAILTLDGAPAEGEVDVIGWSGHGAVESRLGRFPDRALRVTGIANARVARALTEARLLHTASPGATARDIRAASDSAGEQPAAFEALGHRLGFTVAVTWSERGPGAFDVLFRPAESLDSCGTTP